MSDNMNTKVRDSQGRLTYRNLTDIIREPGKFEGEPEYVRALWDTVPDGGADDTIYDGDTTIDVFFLTADDRDKYALDEDDYAILLWEDSQGFVNSRVMRERQYNSFYDACQEDISEDEA